MGLLGEMSVRLSLNTTQFNNGLTQSATKLTNFNSSLSGTALAAGPVVGALTAIGAAAVGLGMASVQAAGEFEATMNKVQALAGVSAKDAQAASTEIMKMAVEVGKSPKNLADGLYYIAGAGYDAKSSLMILRESAKAASVGMTDTETVANAVTASMKALNIPASQTKQTLDMMTATVSAGKTEWKDYASVVGKISINAAQSKISFQEANSAFSQLTNTMPSSKQAADSLNALLQTSSRFDLLSTRADALGISFDKDRYATLNLEQRLRYLNEITGGNQEQMTKLLGRQNAVAAATALMTNNFEGYHTVLKNVTNSSGAADQAFAKVSGGLQMSTERFNAAFDVLKITIGNILLPIVTKVVNGLTPLVSGFTDLLTQASPLSQLFTGMKNNWLEAFAGMDIAGMAKSFTDFEGSTRKAFADLAPLVLPFINNLNNLLIQGASIVGTWVVPGMGILQQVVKGTADVFKTWMLAIESKLMPSLSKLMVVIGPIIQRFLEWVNSSGILPAMFQSIGDWVNFSIDALALFIDGITQTIVNISNFVAFLISLPARIQAGWTGLQLWWSAFWAVITVYADNAWLWIQNSTAQAWTNLQKFVADAGKALLDVITKPFRDIGDWFVWLYNHNHYVEQLVQEIDHWFRLGLSWIETNLGKASKFMSKAWDEIKHTASVAWQAAGNIIRMEVDKATGAIQAGVTAAKNWTRNQWNELRGMASSAWSAVRGVFNTIWSNYLSPPLVGAWNAVKNWWNSNVVGGAHDLGQNMVQGLIDGINSIGQNIANTLNGWLSQAGFHDINISVPGHADGIMNNPTGHWALVGEKGPELMYVPGGASIYPNGVTPSGGGGSYGGGGGTQYITIEFDGDVIMQATADRQAQYVRIRHGRAAA